MVSGLLGVVKDYFQLNVGLLMSVDVGARFVRHLESMSFRFYDERRTGEIISRFSDAQGAVNSTVGLVSTLALSSMQLLIFPAVCLLISWKLTVLALLLYPLDIWIYSIMNRRLYQQNTLVAESRAELQAKLYETLSGIRTVQALGVEKQVEKNIATSLLVVVRRNLDVGRTSLWGKYGTSSLKDISTLILAWFGWHYVIDGAITLGQLIAFSMYLSYLSTPVRSLFSLSQSLQQTLAHANRFFEIYDAVPDIRNRNDNLHPIGNTIESIRFSAVSFAYTKGRPALRSITTDIPVRGMTAIVGRSGAGKTTMVNMLPRFYDPTDGTLFVNDLDVRSVDLTDLRSKIGYVMQRNSFFGGTIFNEITLGRENADLTDVRNAARRAHIDEFIESLPAGYDTPVSEFASNLSEGQRQRIALARMFLLDRPIVVLDEPTSALDIASESLIRKSIDELRSSRTLIVIAHRLNTIERADKVIVLRDGAIVEEGTYQDLIKQGGELSQLYQGIARI
jgi:ABC-type bacteriocin/lantibiotic exporter with double-glycine peptidase domain